MPLTPLHLGPGLAAKIAGERFSLTAYIIANVLIDIEPAVKLFVGSDSPLHTLHTMEGGLAFAAAATIVAALPPFRRGWITSAISAGFGIGAHLFIDALYHRDVAANFGIPELADVLSPTLIDIWLALMILVFGKPCYHIIKGWAAEEYDKD